MEESGLKMEEFTEEDKDTSDESFLKDSTELEENIEREHWSNKMESMLSLIGYCVGLGNIWRFPYYCMRNGGGTFLVAFFFFLIVCGLPMYFVDMVIGQFTGRTALHAWEVCPLLKGIGAGVLLALLIISSYYTIILAWTLFYLGNCFYNPLPWRTCDNKWNTKHCVSERMTTSRTILNESVFTNLTDYGLITQLNNTEQGLMNVTLGPMPQNTSEPHFKIVTSEEEFWERGMLEISSGIHDLGGIPWHLAVCYLAAWIIMFLCLVKGIRSSGKVVYVTACLPYILLTVFLIRAVMLPGAKEGILFYLTPDFEKLWNLQVWLEAALQVFYSLSPAWGPIITLASYNKFNNNCYRDSIILTFICEGTSIYGGFVVFAIVGFMAHRTGLPISEVVTSGPGLVFMTYPEALAHLPLPNLWAVLFFLMLLSVGLDTQFSHMETIVSALLDQFPSMRRRRTILHALSCAVWFLFGLILCTQGGMYVFQLMDWYIGLAIPVFGFIELLIVGWIYGTERFSRDVTMMIGHGIPVVMRIAICFVAPAVLLFVFVFAFGTYKPPIYGEYVYPSYAFPLGLAIGAVPLIPIFVVAFVTLKNAVGDTFIEKVKISCKPSLKWKPASEKHARTYKYHDLKEYTTFWSRLKVNVLGTGYTYFDEED